MGVCYIIEDCNITDAENGDGGNQPNATFLGKVLSEFKKGCQQAFQNRPQRLMAAMYNCAIQVNGEVLGKSRHIHVLFCCLYCATSVWWRRTIEWTIGSDRLLVALDQLECIELVLWGSNVSQEPVRRALSLGVWVSSDTLVCRTPPIPPRSSTSSSRTVFSILEQIWSNRQPIYRWLIWYLCYSIN